MNYRKIFSNIKQIQPLSKIIFIIFFLIIIDFSLSKIFKKKYTNQKKENNISIQHDIFHHHFLPNYTFTRHKGKNEQYTITTNSLGFRDFKKREVELKNKNRIVIIGDSFAEGFLLEYENTFSGIIQKTFEEKGIDVLNAAISGYSPTIYFHKINYFIKKGLEFSHLVVFLDISDIEDEAIRYHYDTEQKKIVRLFSLNQKKNYKQKIKEFLDENTFLIFKIIKTIDDKFEKKGLQNKFLDFIVSDEYKTDKWTINKDIQNKYKKGIDKSIQNIIDLKKLLDQNNIKLTIVVYPWITQIYSHDLDSLHVKLFKDLAKKNNFQFINLFPVFINEHFNDMEFYDYINKFFIPFDIHYNENAAQLIAKEFIKKFKY